MLEPSPRAAGRGQGEGWFRVTDSFGNSLGDGATPHPALSPQDAGSGFKGEEPGAVPRSQSLAGAVISSLLLAGWIAWQMGWVWALAGVFGVLIHELGHLALINALGCGPG